MKKQVATAIMMAWVLLGCSGEDVAPLDPGDSNPPPQAPELSTALSSRCYGWPAQRFTIENAAPTQLGLTTGDLAVDFTLEDLDGNAYTLSQLLATKPVLLVTGSYT